MAAPTTTTESPVNIDDQVSDLARRRGGAAIEHTISDQCATDTGADKNAEQSIAPTSRAEVQFAERRPLYVVTEADRQAQALTQALPDRDIREATEIWRGDDPPPRRRRS